MPAKKSKTAKTEAKPEPKEEKVEEKAAAENESPKPEENTSTPVVVEPPSESSTETPAQEEKPQQKEQPNQAEQVAEKTGSMVKEGALASAIADLASTVAPENKSFEPVGVSVEPDSKQAEKVPVEGVEKPQPEKKKKGQGLWLVVAFLAGLGAGIVMGWWLWGQGEVNLMGSSEQETSQVVNAKPTSVPEPTTGEPIKVDRSKLKLQVLNGNGGKGVAAEARDALESMGYEDIEVGNADREDYEMTEISIKDGSKMYLETLRADVSSKYQVAESVGTLDEGSSYDAVVIIGLK